MTARSKFVAYALNQLGHPCLWGAKGVDPVSGLVAFDCSGLVTCALVAAGGPNLEHVDNAQALYDATQPIPVEVAEPGDLLFYDDGAGHIIHVGIWLAGAHAIDAAGATPRLPTIELAQQSGASVRTHDRVPYRQNFAGVRRNHWLDDLDAPKEKTNG